ncbi:hypothetical protein BV25DRAFT_1824107 [Artomyces pyxidatus]|uniref:Uncharacterized protein n=1 Tax=Artomyces pyxidatus TaxID=48021 RepID=A0ACB8T495_9AGAM|nr:hypothetical protein BV25DRAFT_1824107 [Artomyces pyxidatus]
MPFYQMVCIAAHNAEYVHIKELVRLSATQIMNQGGVVRGIKYWGLKTLPQRMRQNRVYHSYGDYWSMHFDASPSNQRDLSKLLRKDPRVIRATVLKMGEKIEDVVVPREKTIRNPMGVPEVREVALTHTRPLAPPPGRSNSGQ